METLPDLIYFIVATYLERGDISSLQVSSKMLASLLSSPLIRTSTALRDEENFNGWRTCISSGQNHSCYHYHLQSLRSDQKVKVLKLMFSMRHNPTFQWHDAVSMVVGTTLKTEDDEFPFTVMNVLEISLVVASSVLLIMHFFTLLPFLLFLSLALAVLEYLVHLFLCLIHTLGLLPG